MTVLLRGGGFRVTPLRRFGSARGDRCEGPKDALLLMRGRATVHEGVWKVDVGSSCDCLSPGLQVGWLGRKPASCLFLEFLCLLGNVCLGFPAQDRFEQRQFLWACSRVKFLPLPALCRSALRGELLPLAVPPQLEATAMASTNCVVFSWHHQKRVECLFLELSPSHNIHFLRVTRGGRIAWGSVWARGMRSPCLMARACAYAASAVAWELD